MQEKGKAGNSPIFDLLANKGITLKSIDQILVKTGKYKVYDQGSYSHTGFTSTFRHAMIKYATCEKLIIMLDDAGLLLDSGWTMDTLLSAHVDWFRTHSKDEKDYALWYPSRSPGNKNKTFSRPNKSSNKGTGRGRGRKKTEPKNLPVSRPQIAQQVILDKSGGVLHLAEPILIEAPMSAIEEQETIEEIKADIKLELLVSRVVMNVIHYLKSKRVTTIRINDIIGILRSLSNKELEDAFMKASAPIGGKKEMVINMTYEEQLC